MATNSKNIYASAAPSSLPFVLSVSFTEKETSIVDNTSTITLTGVLKSTGVSFDTNYNNTLALYWHDDYLNKDILIASINIQDMYYDQTSGTQTVSGTYEAKHNSDGSLKGYAKTVWTRHSSNANVIYVPASNSVATAETELTTIPRATEPTLSASSVTMGESVTINLAPAADTFKHKITYSFGGQAGLTSGLSIGSDFSDSGDTSVTFTPPTSLGDSIPSANSGACTITVQTYDEDGNAIGSAEKVALTINVPSYTPTISDVSLEGNDLLNGNYVQGKSSVSVKIIASSFYGASIKSYSATVDDTDYSGASFASNVLEAGNKQVVVTVTDTRGKTAEYTTDEFTVYSYFLPSISSFTAVRSEDDPTVVIATLTGTYASVNGANIALFEITMNGETKVVESGVSVEFTGIEVDYSYVARATITDVYTSVSRDVQVSTEAVTLDFHSSGRGVALGKVAENENELDVAWDVRFRNNLIGLDGTGLASTTYVDEQDAKLEAEIAYLKENLNGDSSVYVTPQMFGAKADGTTDDTQAIQNMFDSLEDGTTIYFPKGKYIVQHSDTIDNGDYVAILVEGKQNITVIFENGATIKQNLATVHRYTMFRFLNCDGLEIRGGVIEGDRNEHPDVETGYGSKGIQIRNSDNVYVHDMEICNIFGDCMSISGTEKQCENILIENCTFHDSYRNGFTFGGSKHGIIRNCRIYNVSGGLPEAGIDIEAEYGYNNEDITIDGCYIHDCGHDTIAFSSNSSNMKVMNCILDGETQGYNTGYDVEILNTTITGIMNVRNDVTLRNCTVKGVSAYDTADYPNVNFKAYDTVFEGNDSGTTFSAENMNGKATFYFKNCELNLLEGSSYSLFRTYSSDTTEITVDGGCIYLCDNTSLESLLSQGAYASFKLMGCNIVVNSSTLSNSLMNIDSTNVHVVGCNVDMNEVTTCSTSDLATFGQTVSTLNFHGNIFSTRAVIQWLFNLSAFIGNAYITKNSAPTISSLYLLNTSGGVVFACDNVVNTSVDFTAEDKEKLDSLEQATAGKSAYDIYVDNGGTLTETEWLASISSVAPTYASSVEDMTEISKTYIGSEGTLWGQIRQEIVTNKNVFDPSSASLGGYLYTDGTVTTTASGASQYCTTDFLPFDGSSASSYIMTYIPSAVTQLSQNYSRICFYDETKTFLKQTNLRSDWTSTSTYFAQNDDGSYTLELNKMLGGSSLSSSIVSATRYIRFCFMAVSSGTVEQSEVEDIEIYFETNAEIEYNYAWGDTGIQYAHYVMTDTDYEIITNKVLDGGGSITTNVSQESVLNALGYTPAREEHTHDEYLTSVPSEYITETELNAKGYLTLNDLPIYGGEVS